MAVHKKFFFIVVALLAAFAVGNAFVNYSSKAGSGTEEDILIPATKYKGQILRRMAYTVSYNKETRLPNWVAWTLTKQHTYGKYKRSGIRFAEDTEVSKPRATYYDYMQSGYSRGHMCPSGDNRWSKQAQEESFLYTNCCPQSYSLNAGEWNDLEMKCRTWANAYGKIYIVCGPVLYNQKHKTIGKNKVVVPEAFFKVVLCMTGTPKALGLIYPNTQGSSRKYGDRGQLTDIKPMSSFVCTVDEVERITGIDFFPALPDDIENKVEAKANLSEWK